MNTRVKKRMISPTGHGSVLVIAALLVFSATLRLVSGATSAVAQEGLLQTAERPNDTSSSRVIPKQDTAEVSTLESAAMIPRNINKSEMSHLIKALTDRESRVLSREKQLEMRLHALSLAETEIENRIEALTQTEERLRATLALADQASEKDLLRLTSVYESMKPKDAAALFEEMEPNFAAGFLGRMNSASAAQILAGLSPQAAYSISVILAGRNATAPKT